MKEVNKGGKPKIKQYQYSGAEENYRFLRVYESGTEVFEKYFDLKKGSLYNTNAPYRELPDGTYISSHRIGRDGLKKAIRRYEDPTCTKRNDDKPIEIFNYFGEKVGEVSNVRVLKAVMESKWEQSHHHIYDGRKKPWWGRLSYKFKKKK